MPRKRPTAAAEAPKPAETAAEPAAEPKKQNFSPEFLAQMGTGRPKGSKNKIGASIKEALMLSFHDEDVSGVDYLVSLSKTHPAVYAGMLAKLIPANIAADVRAEMVSSEGSETDTNARQLAMRTLAAVAEAMQEMSGSLPEAGELIDITPEPAE